VTKLDFVLTLGVGSLFAITVLQTIELRLIRQELQQDRTHLNEGRHHMLETRQEIHYVNVRVEQALKNIATCEEAASEPNKQVKEKAK